MGTTARGYRYPEGTAAVNVHGDLRNLATDVDADIQSRIDAESAAWTTYTPGWQTGGTNLNIGNGTLVGRYKQVGRKITGQIKLTRGSTTNLGSGEYRFGLPGFGRAFDEVWGTGWVYGGSDFGVYVRGVVTGWVSITYSDTNARVGSPNRFTWAAGHVIFFGFTYETP